MAATSSNWESILKWSLSQSDGSGPARQISEEERRWFQEAVMGSQVDVIKRMKEISTVMQLNEQQLQDNGVTVEELEGVLEELQEHVESIDMANDLQAIGGLLPLLEYLKSPHASLRSRAAEVVTTVVQNNPRSQENVMNAGGLPLLLQNFTSDSDVLVRTKALGAISSLIRHNKAGTDEFRKAGGFLTLKEALKSDEPRFQRKALYVLHYLMQENPSDHKTALEVGYGSILTTLATSADADVRQAALHALVEMAVRGPEEVEELTRPREDAAETLKDVLNRRMEALKTLEGNDIEYFMDERNLLDELWDRCFGKRRSTSEAVRGVREGERGSVEENSQLGSSNTVRGLGAALAPAVGSSHTPVLLLGGPTSSASPAPGGGQREA